METTGVAEAVADGDGVEVGETLTVGEGEGDLVGVGAIEATRVGVAAEVGDTVGERAESVGVGDAVGVEVGVGAAELHAVATIAIPVAATTSERLVVNGRVMRRQVPASQLIEPRLAS